MPRITKADFYFGALLSTMISNGVKPALFEETKQHRIYSFSTNKGDYRMYMKYAASPLPRKNTDVQLWQFNFTADEIKIIKGFKDSNEKYYFALICGNEKFNDSEILILSLKDGKDCLDVNYIRDSHRITAKYEKNGHGLKVYGTGRADILNGVDNTIKVSREALLEL